MTDLIDALDLSALLASKVCHDLINPIGAMSTGIEVLDGETDPEMRHEAMRLIEASAKKAVAGLSYARIAYGAGGAYGSEVDLDEARKAAQEMFAFVKPELVWRAASGLAPKTVSKVALVLALATADCVPRGGSVTVDGDGTSLIFTARGPKARLYDKLAAALAGDAAEIEPKWVPVYIAGILARRTGGGVSAEIGEETVVLTARFSNGAA